MQQYTLTEITGILFNKLIGEKKIYKVLDNNLCHNNFQYKIGLNIDTNIFNPIGECQSSGLYFCEEAFLFENINYGEKIATVEILDDARVYVENNKFKADKIILSNIILLKDFDKFTDPIFCKLAVQKHWNTLKFVKEQTEEICNLAIQNHILALTLVRITSLEQTYKICKFAVQHDGWAIKYVRLTSLKQTEEICKLAVQQNGLALQYVEMTSHEQTEDMCKLAVQENGWALSFVKKQTEEICKLAVQQNGMALEYVKDQTEEICNLAIQQNRWALEFVKITSVKINRRNMYDLRK